MRDETVQALQWGTRGVYDVQDVVPALKAKFGQPTKAEKLTIRSQQGATFDGWTLRWDRPGYVVHYSSQNAFRHLEAGNVIIRTADEERRAVAESPETKRPL